MREISIGFPNATAIQAFIDDLEEQLQTNGDAQVIIKGNGGPDLRLSLIDEQDDDFQEPLVDYDES